MFKLWHKDATSLQALPISPEHQQYLKHLQREIYLVKFVQIFILAAIFGLWEIFASLKILDPFIFSQPSRIFKTMIMLYQQGVLMEHITVTCIETIVGFILGTTLGTILAIVFWWSSFISRVLEPYLIILNSLPKIALGPIFIVWIGAGPAAIIMMTLAISLIVTILEVLNGFSSIDNEKIKLVKTFGGTKLQIMTKVILPASLPTIVNALKINVGLSWVGVIVGEFLVSKAGLGYLIVYGGQVFKLDLVMTSVLILGFAAAIMYKGVVLFEKMLLKQRKV